MIRIIGMRKTNDAKDPIFQLAYVDLEKQNEMKGYVMDTRYATESEFRLLLPSTGMTDAVIDQLFASAQ